MIWLHNIRFISVFAVILLHSSASFYDVSLLEGNLQDYYNWWGGNLFNSLTRWCVPVFVMVSGYLLIDKGGSIKQFYLKRLNRLLYPIIFWSLFFTIFLYFKLLVKGEVDFFYTNLRDNMINGAPYYHLWYLFMIPFIYFVTPYVRLLNSKLTKHEYLVLSLFCLFMPVVNLAWNFIFFNNISGSFFGVLFVQYLGYYMIGGWFSKYTVNFKNGFLVCFMMASFFLTLFGTFFFSAEYFYNYLSLNVCVSSICIFLLFKNSCFDVDFFGFSKTLSNLSFGIYLVHPLYLEMFSFFIKDKFVHATSSFIYIPISSFVTFFLSAITIYFFMKVGVLSKTV